MISIIIPTIRSEKEISVCLDAIKEHTTDYELILVREGKMNEAANIGAKKATGKYLIFLHDDIEVFPGWSDALAPIGGFQYGEHAGKFWIQGGIIDPPGYCPVGAKPDYTAFLCISKHMFNKVGEFDESYTTPGYQDTDYGMQIRKAGYSITPLPGKMIHHHFRTKPISPENEAYFKEKWNVNK